MFNLLLAQKAVDRIVAYAVHMFIEMGRRVVDRIHQQVLAVIKAGGAFRHAFSIVKNSLALGFHPFVINGFVSCDWNFA